jgi:hypothetical protein
MSEKPGLTVTTNDASETIVINNDPPSKNEDAPAAADQPEKTPKGGK